MLSERRISIKKPQEISIDLTGYNIGQTTTESSTGETLIYVSQSLSYKL